MRRKKKKKSGHLMTDPQLPILAGFSAPCYLGQSLRRKRTLQKRHQSCLLILLQFKHDRKKSEYAEATQGSNVYSSTRTPPRSSLQWNRMQRTHHRSNRLTSPSLHHQLDSGSQNSGTLQHSSLTSF